jgi:hypothetical protein
MPDQTVEILTKFLVEGDQKFNLMLRSMDSLTGTSEKASKASDQYITRLSRQADMAGKTAKQQLELKRVFDLLDYGKTTKQINDINEAYDKLIATHKPVAESFSLLTKAAIASAAAFAGKEIYQYIRESGQLAEQSVNLADRIGITVTQAEKWSAMARIAGVNVGALEGSGRALAAALEDTSGQGAKAAAALRQLGIETVTGSGANRDWADLLKEVLEKLGQVESTSERIYIAQKVLPRGAATELLPLIRNYKDLQKAVDELGVGMNPGLIEKLAKADDGFDKVTEKVIQLKKELAGFLSGPAAAGLEFLVDAINLAAGKGQKPGDSRRFGAFGDLRDVGAGNPRPTSTAGIPIATETPESAARPGLRAAAAARFRDQFTNTERGQRARLTTIGGDIANLERALSGPLDLDVRERRESEYKNLLAEAKRLEALLKAEGQFKGQYRVPESEAIKALNEQIVKTIQAYNQDIVRRSDTAQSKALEGATQLGGPRIDPDVQAFEFNQAAISTQLRAFQLSRGSRATGAAPGDISDITRRGGEADAGRQALIAAQVRLLELSENEYDAARRIYDLRKSTAETVVESKQAELDYSIRIAEIDKRRLESYKQQAGQVFDALTASGGGGLKDFFGGQLKMLERGIFVNASAGIFQKAGGALGKIGGAIPGGATIFKGTILDPQNAASPEIRAREDNTKAIQQLTAVMAGGMGIGGQSGLPIGLSGGIPGMGPGGTPFFLPQLSLAANGGSRGNMGSFFAGMAAFGTGNPFRSGDYSVYQGNGQATTASSLGLTSKSARLGMATADAGAIIGGAYGVKAGIQEGGAKGTFGAISAGAGAAAAVDPEPISKSVLAIVAMSAGMISALLPSMKEQFEKQQIAVLEANRWTAPDAMSETYDIRTGSSTVDYDYRGRTRVVVQPQIVIQAMDAQSVIDRGADIATAVQKQMDAGHPINQSVSASIFGA